MVAYHAVAVEAEGTAWELAGVGVCGEGQAVRQRGPHEVRVAEQRDVAVLVVRGDRRGVTDEEDVGAVAVGLLLFLLPVVITAGLRDERQDLLPEVDQDDMEERDPAAVGRAHQLVPVARVPLAVGGLEGGEESPRLHRRRERQQLLPEHQVLPHPAPDGVREPPTHGEAERVPVGAEAGVEDVQLAAGAHVALRA